LTFAADGLQPTFARESRPEEEKDTMAQRKKLYYDVLFTFPGDTTVKSAAFRCTQFTVGTVSGERYGGFADALAALAAAAPPEKKRQNAVGAWFEVAAITGTAQANTVSPAIVDFVDAATLATPLANLGNATFAGQDVVYTSHFGVRVRLAAVLTEGDAATIRGTLYVQRQHSIEV
jgi:hypothetical protein